MSVPPPPPAPVAPTGEPPAPAAGPRTMTRDASHHAYSRMLKATSTVAGAKIATILVSVIRMKAIASLLGPGGFGFINLVSSSIEFTRVLTNLGLDGAIVRSFAEANARDDKQKLAILYRVAVRSAFAIGLASWTLFTICSPWLSRAATGSHDNAWLFILGGASLLFTPMLAVQLGVLQGLRQINSLAKCQVVSSPIAAAITILLIFLYGEAGGVAALAVSSVASLAIHYRFLRTLRPSAPINTPIPYRAIIRGNLRDGMGFAINGLWLTASGWLNLVLVRNYYGDQGMVQVGMLSAASLLASFYVAVVIAALATEFYPSLTAEAAHPEKMRNLLNRQAVLALDSGILASMILMICAPLALRLLYSKDFTAATDIMRLMLIATGIRFAAFPLGYAILALGRARLFAICELAIGVTTIAISWLMISYYGLPGLGFALVIANTIHVIGLLLVTRRLQMTWNRHTASLATIAVACLGMVSAAAFLLPGLAGPLVASAVAITYGGFAIRRIQEGTGLTFAVMLRKLRPRARG